MTCAHCQALQVRVRELEEEVAEWERGGRDEAAHAGLLAHREAVRRWLGCKPGAVRMLLVLLGKSPTIASKVSLMNALTAENDRDYDLKTVDVYVCQLRQAIDDVSSLRPIKTVWGQGYYIGTDDARLLKALIAEQSL